MLPNFNLSATGRISIDFMEKDIKTFHQAIQYVKNIPYGRGKKKYPFNLLKENKATCSTKHALIKELAQENNIYSIQLMMGIYTMDKENTPKIEQILTRYNLDYMLEAHVYLMHNDLRYDYTFPDNHEMDWESSILMEMEIDVDQIFDYKVQYHKKILQDWIDRDKLNFTLQKLWEIRESCIHALQTYDI